MKIEVTGAILVPRAAYFYANCSHNQTIFQIQHQSLPATRRIFYNEF